MRVQKMRGIIIKCVLNGRLLFEYLSYETTPIEDGSSAPEDVEGGEERAADVSKEPLLSYVAGSSCWHKQTAHKQVSERQRS